MPKYLFRTRYTQAGVSGLIREGGTGRREALRQTVEGLGGTLEVSTTVLLSPETIDGAVKRACLTANPATRQQNSRLRTNRARL